MPCFNLVICVDAGQARSIAPSGIEVDDELFDPGRRGVEHFARQFFLEVTPSAATVNSHDQTLQPRACRSFVKVL
jgi:hypothetical protein